MKQIQLPVQWNTGHDSNYGFSTAQKNIKKALEKSGVVITKCADKELFHMSAHLYNRNKDIESILWYPYEANNIPQKLVDKANEADKIIASCEHNADVFKNAGITSPIHICNIGVDTTNIFKFRKRTVNKKFVFLWIGMNNPRKGWDIVSQAFIEEFENDNDVVLYMKTTGNISQDLLVLHERVVIDTRNLSDADLLDLYYDSHAFVFPSRGEATGMPVMEAMATGCLVLAPSIMGMKDFVSDDTAVSLDYNMISANYGIKTKAPNVEINTMRKAMRNVYENYNDYNSKILAATNLINEKFSLKNLGKNLVDIIWN